MRFLIDENLGAGLTRWLVEIGHDAVAVADVARGSDDETALRHALDQQRILITEDKDFGELVRRRNRPHAGLVLLRLRRSLPTDIRREIEGLLVAVGHRLEGRFVVVREGRVRIT